MAKNPNPDIFLHESGLYDISALQNFVAARRRYRPRKYSFDDPRVARMFALVRDHYSWNRNRAFSASEEKLRKPLLLIDDPGRELVLLDGAHRLIQLSTLSNFFRAHPVPGEIASRFRAF